MLSTWEILPDLPERRIYHGCGRTDMNNNPYLIVFGGESPLSTPLILGDVKFLNLNQKNLGWVNLPGIRLSGPRRYIHGSFVKHLSSTNCDMMFVEYYSGLNVCKGNFNWTTYVFSPVPYSGLKRLVPVGLNAFPTCA